MKKNLRWKVILILAVIAFAVFLFYPPGQKIQFGLDLEGGMHLVMQVVTDDAIENETNLEVLRLQELLDRKNISFESITLSEERVDRFTLEGFDLEKETEFRTVISDYFKEWDISFIGNSVRATLKVNSVSYLRDQTVRQAMETLRNRVDELGLSEIPIQRQGLAGERIIVELPGVENPERVKNILKTTAQLKMHLVISGPSADQESLLSPYGGELPDDMEILEGDPDRTEGGYYLINRIAPVTGKDLRSARRGVDEWNRPAVLFSFNPDGSRRFADFTGEHVNEPLGIVLDNKIQEVANIGERIPGDVILHGNFTIEDAEDIALVLRAGALPANIKYLEERTIGPSLGADSVRKGFTAIVASLLLVMVFMVFYYRLSGFNAILALVLNILILMGALSYFKAHLTLPGIAGIILTIGMAVDANVLVFERIREELTAGKSVVNSIGSGFSRAFRTILDANVTTIIAAIFLFQFGTGPLRGFAITLIIGIAASMFTAIFVSRTIFDLAFSKRKKHEKLSI